jgi:hypothetical protein
MDDELEEVAAQLRLEIEAAYADHPQLLEFWLAMLAQQLERLRRERILH